MLPSKPARFKEQIKDPTLENLLEKTDLKEGLCYINNLEIVFTDEHNWGHLCYIRATGLMYRGCDVKEFSYEATDIDMGVLTRETKKCLYLMEGEFHFYDSKANLEITTNIGNVKLCGKLYPELLGVKDLSLSKMTLEWIKLRTLYDKKNRKTCLLNKRF